MTLVSPFVLRSVAPPIGDIEGARVIDVSRSGKQIVFAFEGGRFLVVHLMVAGRFQWRDDGPPLRGRIVLARFEFSTGTLYLTEASSKKRASIHVVAGAAGLRRFRGALEVLDATAQDFGAALRRENHTLKRALTDPRLLSGIGGAYSDEILHRAQLSPLQLTSRLTEIRSAGFTTPRRRS